MMNTNRETDFEELNLPEVPHNRSNTSSSPEPIAKEYRGEELFQTYKQFLTNNSSGLYGGLPAVSSNSNYSMDNGNVYGEPRTKRRKGRGNEFNRSIEKSVVLSVRFDLNNEEMDRMTTWANESGSIESVFSINEQGKVLISSTKAPLRAFWKLMVGDELVRLNSQPLSNPTISLIREVLSKPAAEIELIFKCHRLLKLSKMCHLKGDMIDPEKLNDTVESLGGYEKVNERKLWQSVRDRLNLQFTTSSSHQLKSSYISYFNGVLI